LRGTPALPAQLLRPASERERDGATARERERERERERNSATERERERERETERERGIERQTVSPLVSFLVSKAVSPSGDEMPSLNKFERNTRTACATAAPCKRTRMSLGVASWGLQGFGGCISSLSRSLSPPLSLPACLILAPAWGQASQGPRNGSRVERVSAAKGWPRFDRGEYLS